jgi:hypothetical protein
MCLQEALKHLIPWDFDDVDAGDPLDRVSLMMMLMPTDRARALNSTEMSAW